MTSLFSRRAFLGSTARALGGVALLGSTPHALLAHTGLGLRDRKIWTMGTWAHATMPEAGDVEFRSVFDALTRVSEGLSAHSSASALGRLNDTGSSADSDLVRVAQAAHRIHGLSDGALDVTVLPAMRRLGFIPGEVGIDQIDQSRMSVSEGRVTLDSGSGVDFGGIAKGYGVDRAVADARAAGVTTALVDAGGDIFALGRPAADRMWRVGIRNPLEPMELVAKLDLENEAIATSGTYFQQRQVAGKTVSHLIDPATGQSVSHVLSASIVAQESMTADALATATSIMSPAAARALIESLPGVEAFWIYADGSHAVTGGLKSRLTMI